MTASLAGRKSVRCVIRKPLARFRIFLWRRRAGALRLTRGISVLLLQVRRCPAQPPSVLTGQHQPLAVFALPAPALVAEPVALFGGRPPGPAGLGYPGAPGP